MILIMRENVLCIFKKKLNILVFFEDLKVQKQSENLS